MATLLASLAALALIDSSSFGTLLIPVWLLAAPGRVRVGRIGVYLATVVGFYLAVGLVLLLGADAFLARFDGLLDSRAVLVTQFVVGAALFAGSFALDSKGARARAAARAAAGGGRVNAWRRRATGAEGGGSNRALVTLALTATAVELASMLPYLAGIGLIGSRGPGWPGSGLLLLGYCAVMVVPAVVLLLGRVVAARALDRPLARLDRWLTRNAASTTAWVIGIVGFLLATRAVGDLGWTS